MSTEAVTRPDGAAGQHLSTAPGGDSPGREEVGGRWRLRRGGVVNIWQYANQTFDLSGGRAIFQGTNGSGKSRTLELLLPLCLDGDLRQIGSKGFDTVSMKRLMLDERESGGNRLGYAWVELSRTARDGSERFLTCGIGVKATATSNQISDSWRFVTERRVEHDLRLIGSGEVPLSQPQLRDELGAECLHDEQSFRARIAGTVYGITPERYGDLLHLQRTLRNPDVGLRVQEGQLEQILSDALPPLDSTLIQRLATSFEDLESIRENILRLTTADSALSSFLTTYADYALTVLRTRAKASREAARQHDSLHTTIDELAERYRSELDERSENEELVGELEQRDRELDSSLGALRQSPAYTELQNLHDRRALVDNERSAAEGALRTAERHRDQEQRSASTVLGMLERLSSDIDAAEQHRRQADAGLRASGLDGSLAPAIPTMPPTEATVRWEVVRGTADSGSEWLDVARHIPPQPDTEELASRLREVDEHAAAAVEAARERGALTLTLRQQAEETDRQRAEVSDAERQAEAAKVTATEAAARRNQVRQDLYDTAVTWLDRVRRWWHDSALASEAPGTPPPPESPTPEQLTADRFAARGGRERMREWAQPVLHRVRMRITELDRKLAETRSAVSERDTELAELRSGGERVPASPNRATPERDPASGEAFYRLVDFAESLPESERAALEGALEACGLLNAWVTADGTATDAATADVVATPGERLTAGSLADLLVPAAEPDCCVPDARIEALLRSVAVADTAGTAVRTDGHWRTGVLSGAWRKETAEYVGAGARNAARQQRITELEAELAELRAELGEVERQRAASARHAESLERELESYPDDDELFSAHARLSSAVDDADEAQRTANRSRQAHEQAEARWQAMRSELSRAAGRAGLQPETEALQEANRAATDARRALETLREAVGSRCLGTLKQLGTTVLHHDATVADRMAAESLAEQHCANHAEQAAALAELTASVDDEGKRVAEQVAELTREQEQLRERLPEVRERIAAAREEAGKLDEKLTAARARLSERESESRAAASALRRAMELPGLWAAAVAATEGELPESPDGVEEAATALLSTAVTRSSPGSTTAKAVHDKLHPLQQSLSGHFDVTTAEEDEVLTVTVIGEEGPLPVAEAALRISRRLVEQREYLNEQYRSIFADYLIRDLAERLRDQIAVARDLCDRMNRVLEGARSSQGVHVQLDWQPATALSEDLRQAIEVVRKPFAERGEQEDALLRRVFTELIESQRESVSGGYGEILAKALDYRDWYEFTVRVRDSGPDNRQRVRRLRQLSSGETRLVSYVTLFAAAASFYDAIESASQQHDPLRLVLLDEAFERLDDPTVARMLGLLVDLDMDWMITWPSGWGVSPKIPKMHIYDVLRPRSGHGIACTHTVWNGRGLERTEH
ncbi:TIGR02680 family protein [Actinopolyspora mzabensis]|uniref:TIGR02680 family protein n=1 Tax=Actinopolyspora mzabensis TaxID=995066 RepID=A0A1G9E040_ACTMZ|nr:TIGR02680 family protein [Actinopolyspora mzabensis]SDK69430.1 TIGR02680 family protein [Actinopolyspora mzabensis]